MKKSQYFFLLCLFIIHLFTLNCKTTEFEVAVLVGEGIQGSPSQGLYVYKWLDSIWYTYNTIEGYTNLKVMLDGVSSPSSGQIQVADNHTITVTAEKE